MRLKISDSVAAAPLMVYSSAQWFTSLDLILERAVELLIDQTYLIEHYVSQIINYQHTYKKRHVSNQNGSAWQVSLSYMVQFLFAPNITSFKAVGFDRGFTLAMLDDFCRITEGYMSCYTMAFRCHDSRMFTAGFKLADYHNRVGLKQGIDILQLVSHVRYLHLEAIRLKNMIINNYRKYIQGIAYYDAKNHILSSDPEDLEQGYYIAASKAVDHFNLERGAFKSYMDTWIKKSRNMGHHFTGGAFAVPSGVHANHLYVSLDDLVDLADSEQPDQFDIVNQNDDIATVLALARMVDPGGYGQQALQLGEQ